MSAEMPTEAIPQGEQPDNVIMTKEDYFKIANAMEQYKKIEMAYIGMKAGTVRRVLVTFLLADIIFGVTMGLVFTEWERAVGFAAIAFAAIEAFMAAGTFLADRFKRAP